MRKVLLGLALLAPFSAAAQTLPQRGQSGFDTGPVVNCISIDGSTTARCLMPGVVPYGANGQPIGTAANPIVTSSATGGAQQVQGDTASGATDAGNPVKIGYVATADSASPTAVASGQRVNGWAFSRGNQAVSLVSSDGNLFDVSTPGGNQYIPGRMLGTRSAISGYNTNSVYEPLRIVNAPDVGTGIGVLATVAAPTNSAGQGIAPTGADGAVAFVAKTASGNLFSVNEVNGAGGHYLVAINATATPASGTATPPGTGSGQRMYCAVVPAGTAAAVLFRDTFTVPLYGSVGITLLASTSCGTYTPVSTAPVTIGGQVK